MFSLIRRLKRFYSGDPYLRRIGVRFVLKWTISTVQALKSSDLLHLTFPAKLGYGVGITTINRVHISPIPVQTGTSWLLPLYGQNI